ncbi:hypothetical protein I314_05620 [Cryptococcus bacillisporus CA1873]|uniref:Uncharacterized protein n=1 Tax=Cryptococcus bacillisporus CA1873 TaxID=1296111 RepID=A0ABR5B463_CRYGA|nr:hypothetical protein I314_05620 [Cryptococcus bacillisporus CA1873]|eukprot:KIR58378.1 hypothetical protein I314_05620 [Cryptococcus gattii CA1873]
MKTVGHKIEMNCCELFANQRGQAGGTVWMNPFRMSAIPRMLSIAREEATVLTTELATAARTTATEGFAAEARIASEAMNPAAVKQAAEMSAKESSEGQALERDLGVTLKEAMSNAAGTGLEDQVDHFTDATKTLIKGRAPGEAVRLT